MLIMVDGAVLEEQYLEYSKEPNDDWNAKEELTDQAAQWFFY